jgi:arylsulfatase A-like enzyme
MFQKWHQAYEESSHVPFIMHNPTLFSGRQTLDAITSHADLLPTMLGLAGLSPARPALCTSRSSSPATSKRS